LRRLDAPSTLKLRAICASSLIFFFFESLEIKTAFLLGYLDASFADFYYVITTIIVPGGHPTHNGSSLI